MAKILLSMPDLRRRALAEIRQQAGCHNVQDIAINRVPPRSARHSRSPREPDPAYRRNFHDPWRRPDTDVAAEDDRYRVTLKRQRHHTNQPTALSPCERSSD